MKTIIIDEKTVSVDGVIFERKEPEFKVDQWYKWENKLFRVKEVGKDYIMYDNSYISGYPGFQTASNVAKESVPATHSEIEEHLIKVAKEKGFKEGIKIIGLTSDGTPQLRSDSCSNRFGYDKHDDSLDSNGLRVYCKGKWASILPDKKKLPNDKKGIGKLIELYHDQNDGLPFKTPVDEFFNDYE